MPADFFFPEIHSTSQSQDSQFIQTDHVLKTKWDVIYGTNYESPMNDAHVQIFNFLKS